MLFYALHIFVVKSAVNVSCKQSDNNAHHFFTLKEIVWGDRSSTIFSSLEATSVLSSVQPNFRSGISIDVYMIVDNEV